MRITADEYAKMPPELRRLFDKVPNPGSDEVLAVFPDRDGAVSNSSNGTNGTPVYGDYGPQPRSEGRADSGSAARFFYTAKASKSERDEGLYDFPEQATRGNYGDGIQDNRPHTKDGYEYHATRRNTHPTVKPLDLMRWLVRLVTPPDGVVLDPFMGSGTTLKAARAEGHVSIGIDLDEAHCAIAWGRMSQGVLL